MEDFKENRCRICHILFCCKPCREKHETNKHNIFPECDICIHGKTVLKDPSSPLLAHLHASHWPLHCVFCRKVFGSTEELLKKCKCPIGHNLTEDVEKSPYSPLQIHDEHTYESPPLSALYSNEHQANKNPSLFSSLATSTPMQKGEENNLLEKMQGITPVDYSEIKESIIKKKLLDSTRSGSPKRVTFSDTPLADSNKKQKNILKKEDCQNEETIFSTPPSNLGTPFYSITEEVHQKDAQPDEESKQPINQTQDDLSADENSEKSNNQSQSDISAIITTDVDVADSKEDDKLDTANALAKKEESPAWLSAIDISASELNDNKKPTPPKTNLYTPVAPIVGKLKKRQVNIVLPTQVVKKEQISNDTDLTPSVFSTPMPFESDVASSDELPAILKPTTNNACKPEEHIPSNSKIELENIDNANQHEYSNMENKSLLANTEEDVEDSIAATTVQGRLWSLMNKVTSAIGQGFSSLDENVFCNSEISLKRSSTDSLDVPPAKRYKLAEVKCRRTIRNLPNIEITRDNTRIVYTAQSMKIFVDKETQTNE